MSPSVWDLPTTSEAASLQGAQVEPSMLELADNALLLQILIEGAHATGHHLDKYS